MNDEAVCRTAPATPGLSMITISKSTNPMYKKYKSNVQKVQIQCTKSTNPMYKKYKSNVQKSMKKELMVLMRI